MKYDIQKSLEIYIKQLKEGIIQTAYITITKYVACGNFHQNIPQAT